MTLCRFYCGRYPIIRWKKNFFEWNHVTIYSLQTVMAHCIYLEEDELKMFQERKVGIAHCPSSNFWYIIRH